MKKNIFKIKEGFTIIETLVAISILMIAITGPLTVANKGYTAAIEARNQSMATFLAQEAIERLNNMKDNNKWIGEAPITWSSGVVPAIFSKCKFGSECNGINNTNPQYDLLGDASQFFEDNENFSLKYYLNYLGGKYSDYKNQVTIGAEVYWNKSNENDSVILSEVITRFER